MLTYWICVPRPLTDKKWNQVSKYHHNYLNIFLFIEIGGQLLVLVISPEHISTLKCQRNCNNQVSVHSDHQLSCTLQWKDLSVPGWEGYYLPKDESPSTDSMSHFGCLLRGLCFSCSSALNSWPKFCISCSHALLTFSFSAFVRPVYLESNGM